MREAENDFFLELFKLKMSLTNCSTLAGLHLASAFDQMTKSLKLLHALNGTVIEFI